MGNDNKGNIIKSIHTLSSLRRLIKEGTMHPEYQWGYVKAKVGAVERSLQQLTINANDKENIMLLFGDMESTLYPFNPELFCKRNKALTDYMYFLRRCEVSHDKKR